VTKKDIVRAVYESLDIDQKLAQVAVQKVVYCCPVRSVSVLGSIKDMDFHSN
jgi:hypothetical protein